MALLTVKRKSAVWWAIQYVGPINAELNEFLTGAAQVLNTVTLAGVWKLQMVTDSSGLEKASVNDWILKDGNGAFKIVKENKFATDWEIVVP